MTVRKHLAALVLLRLAGAPPGPLLATTAPRATVLGCQHLNYCSGHGRCRHVLGECACDEGYGSPAEAAALGYRPSPDCAARVCPLGRAWADVPYGDDAAHGRMAECSNAGRCDRTTGTCACFPGFRGTNCERTVCPGGGNCSGHGRCASMRQLARAEDALPLSSSTAEYEGESATSTWDQDRVAGCICDSGWPVGLGAGETQESEWFGADCSLRRCPSGDNPDTAIDETDCSGIAAAGGRGTGVAGNLCHHSCSGKGRCDFTVGACQCYDNHIGPACEIRRVR